MRDALDELLKKLQVGKKVDVKINQKEHRTVRDVSDDKEIKAGYSRSIDEQAYTHVGQTER